MPEIDNSMGPSSHESGTINNIRLAGKNRLEQQRIFLRIVFQVCILHDDDVAGGGAKSRAERGALALVGFMIKSDVNRPAQSFFNHCPSPVGRTIIDQNDLEIGYLRFP